MMLLLAPMMSSVLEEFAVIMYDRSSSTNKVNDASLDLFARKQRPYNGIPPSRAALVEHIKRSVLQAAIGANDVQCGTQTPLSFFQPHLEGDGKVGDLHSDCPQVCPACKTDLLTEFGSFASYKTTTACILAHVQ
jgi:hypothetical protein